MNLIHFALLAFLISDSAFACIESSPTLFVQAGGLRPGPGGSPPIEDGTQQHPFGTITTAAFAGGLRQYCTTTLKLANGVYSEGAIKNFENLSIVGSDREKTVIRGGLYSYGPVKLTLKELKFQGAAGRSVLVQGGTFNFTKVTVDQYRFSKTDLYARPTAIAIMNSQGSITGLRVNQSDAPALRVEGVKSRVKASFVSVEQSQVSSSADLSEEPLRYAAAIEITDGALVNLVLTDVFESEYVAIAVRDQAQLYASQIGIKNMRPPKQVSTAGGFMAYRAKAVEMNHFTVENAGLWGLFSSGSAGTFQEGRSKNQQCGLVNFNSPTGLPGYNAQKCLWPKSVDLSGNFSPYFSDVMNVPNEPLPVPCFNCNGGSPSPTPTPVPIWCPKVERW